MSLFVEKGSHYSQKLPIHRIKPLNLSRSVVDMHLGSVRIREPVRTCIFKDYRPGFAGAVTHCRCKRSQIVYEFLTRKNIFLCQLAFLLKGKLT